MPMPNGRGQWPMDVAIEAFEALVGARLSPRDRTLFIEAYVAGYKNGDHDGAERVLATLEARGVLP